MTLQIAARVIPAGVYGRPEGRGVRDQLRLVVQLHPVKPEENAACEHCVALDAWPRAIHERLTGVPQGEVPLSVSPVSITSGRCAAPGDGSRTIRARLLGGFGKLREQELLEVQRLWQAAIGSQARFQEITEALKTITAPEACLADTAATGGGPGTAAAGAATSPFHRSDAALLYTLERAKLVRGRLGQRPTRQAAPAPVPVGSRLQLAAFAGDGLGWGGLAALDDGLAEDAPFSAHAALFLAAAQAHSGAIARERQDYLETRDTDPQAVFRLAQATPTAASDLPDPHQVLAAMAQDAAPGTESDRILKAERKEVRVAHARPMAAFVENRPGSNPAVKPEAPRPDETLLPLLGLRAFPVLERLFGFAFEVEVSLAQLLEHLDASVPPEEPDWARAGQRLGYGYLSVAPEASLGPGHLAPWTIARLRVSPDRKTALGFMPCTREEIDLLAAGCPTPRALGIMQHVEGVLDLGQTVPCVGAGNARNARYDLLSLDVIAATSADMQQVVGDAALAPTERLDLQTAPAEALRLATGGFAIIDRQRSQETIRQAATDRHAAACQLRCAAGERSAAIVLDASDLTVGYRVDVALRTRRPELDWRSLMQRRVRFEASCERLLGRLLDGPGLGPEWRRRLDEGVAHFALRQSEAGQHAEEMIGPWYGDPLGLSTASAAAVPLIDRSLRVSATLSLPDGANDRRPPRQRFGWSYAFGMRPVFGAGVSLAPEEAGVLYGGFRGQLALPTPGPADGAPQGRVFRRQERIDRPTVTLPLEQIGRVASAAGGRAEIRLGMRQLPVGMTAHMVVRTLARPDDADGLPRRLRDAYEKERATFAVARRVILPPPVAEEFAAFHGAFDTLPEESFAHLEPIVRASGAVPRWQPVQGLRPRDGLRRVDFDAAWGGFPVLANLAAPHPASPAGDEDDQVEIYSLGPGGKPDAPWDALRGPPPGDAVFRLRRAAEGPSRRRIPYYPDPVVQTLMLALRLPGGRPDAAPLRDEVLAVPAYADETTRGIGLAAFPDVVPVVVELHRETAASGRPRLRWHRERSRALWAYDPALGTITAWRGDAAAPRDVVAVRVVEIHLAPGEDFDLACWCVPTALALSHGMEIAESVALLEQAERGAAGGQGGTGPAGLPLPAQSEIARVAARVSAALLAGPVPEVAATGTIRVTHALDRPIQTPAFAARADLPAPRLLRTTAQRRDAIFATPNGPGGALWSLEDQHQADAAAVVAALSGAGGTADGPRAETVILVDADVAFSQVEAEALEIRLAGAGIGTATFDDPLRGRTRQQRASGLWPEISPGVPIPAKDLFGFYVLPDGRVVLPQQTATLLRLQGLPSAATGPLRVLQAHAASVLDPTSEIRRRAVTPPRLNDGKARLLTLTPVTMARHAALIRTRYGEQPATAQSAGALPRKAWLPATLRPDAPAVLTPIPSFRMMHRPLRTERIVDRQGSVTGFGGTPGATRTSFEVEREAYVHIPCARPWFTSGEGERLGIVVWPPHLFRDPALSQALLEDYVLWPDGGRSDIQAFDDQDLGRGGPYVSRIAADPIRGGPAPKGWLMRSEHFPDVPATGPGRSPPTPDQMYREAAELPEVCIASDVAMPLPRQADQPPGAPRETMTVSLVTYAPRFDAAQEHWYADVGINPMDVADPFLRLGLVRYQPCAPAMLRVSEPVVAWTQVLPYRRAEAAVIRADGDATGGARLEVRVSGRARDTVPFAGSVLNLRVVRRERLRSAEGRSAGVSDIEVLVRNAIPANPDKAGALWSMLDIDLAEDPLGRRVAERDAVYVVFVEEVERMPGTSGPNPDAPTASGMRFSAEIVLTAPSS